MTDILIISPHLDDAVLSCGSFILNNTSMPYSVMVATVFTEGDENSNHNLRRLNDTTALKELNAKHCHLGFTDAPFRNSAYNSFSTIMFHAEESENTKIENDITNCILELIKKERVKTCIFPLGIGGHVDHNIVFNCSLPTDKLNICNVLYYEDVPYNLVNNWTTIRIAQKFGSKLLPIQNHLALIDQDYPFLQNYLTNKDDISRSEMLYFKEYNQLKNLKDNNAITLDKHSLQVNRTTKLNAIRYYETEFDILLGKNENEMIIEEVFWRTTMNK